MNRNYLNRLAQVKATCQVMRDHEFRWSNNRAIETVMEKLDAEVVFLDEVSRSESNGSPPVTAVKRSKRRKFAEELLTLSAILMLYAEESQNEELYRRMDFLPSDLLYTHDQEFVGYAEMIVGTANDIGEGPLVLWGIDQERLDGVSEMLNDLRQTNPSPRVHISTHRGMNALVPASLRRARRLSAFTLRKLMLPFKETDAEFFQAFIASLTIVDRRGPGNPGEDSDNAAA